MSKFDYVKARSVAESLIDKFGAAGSVYTLGESGGEDMLGNPLPDLPGIVIDGLVTPLLPYKTSTQMTSYETENVISGDKFAFFHSDSLVKVGMLIDADSYTWRVESINSLNSNDGINIFQKLMLRH